MFLINLFLKLNLELSLRNELMGKKDNHKQLES